MFIDCKSIHKLDVLGPFIHKTYLRRGGHKDIKPQPSCQAMPASVTVCVGKVWFEDEMKSLLEGRGRRNEEEEKDEEEEEKERGRREERKGRKEN